MIRLTPEQKQLHGDLFGCPVAELRCEADHEPYDDAIFDYQHDLNRPKLMRRLLALGIDVEHIRWAADNPGQGCACS